MVEGGEGAERERGDCARRVRDGLLNEFSALSALCSSLPLSLFWGGS